MKVSLSKSNRDGKKFMVKVQNRTIHFGQAGADDFTTSKSETKKRSYLARHKVRENWTKSGITTAGFWSRWLLWNKKTISESIKNIERRFNIDIN
jgi:hypothetical protein